MHHNLNNMTRDAVLTSDTIVGVLDTISVVFNPQNQNLTSIIHQFNNILKQGESTKNIFENVKFINSKRHPKNLKRIVCKYNFNDSSCYTVENVKTQDA
jgi:hypothetical protein